MRETLVSFDNFPCGRVGEWLKPADCKSAAPCGLRRFESSPVHHPRKNVVRDIRLIPVVHRPLRARARTTFSPAQRSVRASWQLILKTNFETNWKQGFASRTGILPG